MKKIIIVFVICLAILFNPQLNVLADEYLMEEPIDMEAYEVISNIAPNKKPTIDAHSAIVMDMESGKILYEKDAYTKRSIASTTKIMTAILAIEKGNMGDTVTISKRAAQVRGSTIHLQKGENILLKELLYGLMLKSGNDAAIAIAEHIGGSVEGFAILMNDKAKELGLNNTNYITPHGLDKPGQYSTAYDLAILTKYAFKNEIFGKIVSTVSTSIPNRYLHNTNEMLELYKGADGVKTGFTGQAGRCLVTSATRDDWRIISVVLNCPSRTSRARSSTKILDYAFLTYKRYELAEAGEIISKIPVNKGLVPEVSVFTVDSIVIPLSQKEYEQLRIEIVLPEELKAPIEANNKVGRVEYWIDSEKIAQNDLLTSNSVIKKGFFNYFIELIIEWCNLTNKNEVF